MARQHPKGKTARRATESRREESAKREPYQCECQCENSAGHRTQSRDKIIMRSYWADGVAAVAEEESASPRQGDHSRHARNFRQSRLSRRLCTFEACGCPDALFPQDGLLRRESPRAHAQRGRARVGGWVAGRAVARLGGAACNGAGHKSRGLSAIEADLALLRERLLAMLRLLAVTARRGS